jgi:hypothetical protein
MLAYNSHICLTFSSFTWYYYRPGLKTIIRYFLKYYFLSKIIPEYILSRCPIQGEVVQVADLCEVRSSSCFVFGCGFKSKNVFVKKQDGFGTVFRLQRCQTISLFGNQFSHFLKNIALQLCGKRGEPIHVCRWGGLPG